MKILVISWESVGVDIALRFGWEGHDVRFFGKFAKDCESGWGLIHRVKDWRQHMDWADLIFLTSLEMYTSELEGYFKKGYPIFGTNERAARLELDRVFGMQVMEKIGLEIPPYHEFDNFDEAIQFILDNPARWVAKPCFDADRILTHVGKADDGKDMIYMMQEWKKMNALKGNKFILQEFRKGTEFAVGGWFGRGGWMGGVWEENFEHKKLMNDEIGPNTGEMGTAIKYVKDSKMASLCLEPLSDILFALDFIGSVDVNAIVLDDGTVCPLEFTVRCGWPAFYAHTSLDKSEDMAEWMLGALRGEDHLKCRKDHCIIVSASMPDFPYCKQPNEKCCGVPIYGIDEHNIQHIHFEQVMEGDLTMVEDGKVVKETGYVASGPCPLHVVGLGRSVTAARVKAYKTLDKLMVPANLMYRTDIGCKVEKSLEKLQPHGFATEWRYDDDSND